MDRRSFIRLSSFSAGAWLLYEALPASLAQVPELAASFRPSPLIRIDGNGLVTLYVQKQDMGKACALLCRYYSLKNWT
ncbi:hypothetical protein [Pseudoduganella lutea]|uniref:Uncharacterized protein n=1 Tax=Pseudoduganella lutea TaxID=321985 RepID=A0A4P6L4J3_9BURK|nr:hypothetical protein [Pseudoduganella lutea]QBE66397.1 hypothetical protein EWM63_28340 [Pseudoduganella lutea]